MRLLQATLLAAIGLRLATRRWWTVADRPAEAFEPVAVLSWLDRPLPLAAVAAIWLAGLLAVIVGLVAATRRRSARPALVVAWTALLVLAGLWGSAGKVLHNDLLLLTVTAPVLLAPAARPWREHEVRWGWPPRAALAALAAVYFLTGYQKLRHSGLDWVFSENMRWVLVQGRPVVPAELSRAVSGQVWLTQALAGGALALELTAPLLVAVRRTRVWFAVAVTVMHGAIWLFIGIDYWTWVVAAWAVVLPSSALAARLADRSPRPHLVEPPAMAGTA